ncbi:MAG: signal peptidase I [Nitrososphaeria archaeon]
MRTKPAIVIASVAVTHVVLTSYHPAGMMAYYFPTFCWILIAAVTLWLSGADSLRAWYRRKITLVAFAIAITQILVAIDVGISKGFGRSPLSFSPLGILTNTAYVTSNLLGVELSRAYIMKSYGPKRPILSLAAVTLFYANLYYPLQSMLGAFDLSDPFPIVDYLGASLLPAISASLLSSYLTFLGGPIASLAYRAPYQTFEWFSPILPDLSWGFRVLLGVAIPTFGFIYINHVTTFKDLRRIRVKTRIREPAKLIKRDKMERRSLTMWAIILIIGVLMVWFTTGLLGYFPTVPISGSMNPVMDVGDLAIVAEVPSERLAVGDIIQYWSGEGMVIHRIHEIRAQDGMFITKGDANNAPDPEPVYPQQIKGKVVIIIPKLGWASIVVKDALSRILDALGTLTGQIHMLAAISILSSLALTFAVQVRRSRAWPKPERRLRG